MTLNVNSNVPTSLPVAAAPPTPAEMGSAQATSVVEAAPPSDNNSGAAPAPAAAMGGGYYDAYAGATGYTYPTYSGASYYTYPAAQYATSYSYPSSYGYGATNSTTVPNPASQLAPRTDKDYWTKHIAQFNGPYLPDGPSMRPNCGPASTTMALRMIGLDIPGFSGQRSEAVLDAARYYATGSNDPNSNISDKQLQRLITTAGGRSTESNNFQQLTSWIKQGIPVVLNGNAARGWDSRYSQSQVYHFDGPHWVTVSGYDQKTGFYIVNDPLSQIGPILVSEQELANYASAYGGYGLAVTR